MNRRLYTIVGVVMFFLIAGGLWAYGTRAPALEEGNTDTVSGTPVQIFAYASSRDNGQCSPAGIIGVAREVTGSTTPLQGAIELLLQDPLTEEERKLGLTTEFPLSGVMLTGLAFEEGTLSLTFTDPEHTTSGGSCRVGVLRAQIEATAKQFPEVTSVRILPEDIFQP